MGLTSEQLIVQILASPNFSGMTAMDKQEFFGAVIIFRTSTSRHIKREQTAYFKQLLLKLNSE